MVDGRSVAHQVLFGHRVISIYVKLPLEANPGLHTTYGQKLRAAAASPIMDEPLPLYGPVAEAENMKESWATVFGETSTGGIRRFGRKGMVNPAA